MDNQNPGGFMANAGGGGGPLAAAIARRSGAGALNQQGPGAAGGGSPLPSPVPTNSPQVINNAPTGITGGQGGTPERTDDAHIILKAMSARLKAQDDIAKAQFIPTKVPAIGGINA